MNSDTMTWYTGKNASGTTYYWSEAGVSQYDRPADFDELVARYEMEKLERVVAAPPPPAPPPAPLPAQPLEAHEATPLLAPAHLLAPPPAPSPVPPPPTPPSVAPSPSDFDELCLKTSLRDWLSKLLDSRILDRTHAALEREEVFSVADLAMFCALPRFNECLTALTREKMLNALKDEGLISSTAPAPSSPPGPDDSTPDWLAEASGVLLEKPEGNFCSQDRPRMAATTPIADHYATLGVARESIDEGIRLAYLDRARQTHPEKTTDASADAFNEVHEARDALQHRRATFDREQQAAEEGARQRQAVRLAPVKKAAEASARASRRRDVVAVEPEVAAELRCRSAEIASKLELAAEIASKLELAAEIASKLELAAEIASELELAQAASRHATTQRPAAAPVSARETGYYITATGGGECYHLTPRCSGLLKAGVMRVVSTDGRRLCKTCDRVNAKPLIQASEQISVLRSARHVYYTTRTGKKYHTDRCCSGLSNAVNIIEVPCRPELEACKFCSRIF